MITRCITRPVSVPATTIRGMAGDQEMVTAAATVAAGGDLVPRAITSRASLPGLQAEA